MAEIQENTEISYNCTNDDLVKFCRIVAKSHCKACSGYSMISMFIAVSLAFIALGFMGATLAEVPRFIIGSTVCFISYVLLFQFLSRFGKNTMTDEKGSFIEPRTLTIAADGISSISARSKVWSDWRAILHLERQSGYIMAFTDKASAYVIPERAFSSPEDAEAFYLQAIRYWRAIVPE